VARVANPATIIVVIAANAALALAFVRKRKAIHRGYRFRAAQAAGVSSANF